MYPQLQYLRLSINSNRKHFRVRNGSQELLLLRFFVNYNITAIYDYLGKTFRNVGESFTTTSDIEQHTRISGQACGHFSFFLPFF
jgi:hypothetical protein